MAQLTKRVKAGYGIGDLGGNLFFTMTGFYLLFYLTDVVGMAAGLAGTALMVGKVWDAVTDPAVGFLSDRTDTRFGRRRPWLFIGAWLTLGSMVLMFAAPPPVVAASAGALFAWIVLANCLLNTGYTFINIPYGAMTPDLTDDFHERTVVNGWRMSFAVVGTFVGAGLVLPLVDAFGGGTAGWTGMAGVIGLIIAGTTLIVVFTVQEKPRGNVPPSGNILKSYMEVLALRPFQLAIIPWTLHITGVNILQAALLYYFRFIYGDAGAFQIALPILLASAILCIPLWVRISRSIGKRASYNIGMGIFAASVLVFFAVGHLGGPVIAYIIMAVAGTGFATQYVMPFAIVPDVVEYDYAQNGVRREGVFYGMWTFLSKIGQAAGLALNGIVLSVFGYREAVAGVAAQQPESALIGIRLISGPIPALFFILGILVLRKYPITNEYYREIQEKIRRMEESPEPK
ncbi:MAG: MFS transporter [Alkalispirochaeta sp.]|jgi:GPH family glycoside/pentoside/hexuronide:cation symporter